MGQVKISIIIPSYNRKNEVRKTITSVYKSSLVNYEIEEIILVDNASTDGTAEFIKRKFPGVRVVKSKKNLGAAGGRNLGIKNASRRANYFLFLDSDFILEKFAISELVKSIVGKEKYGAATSKILFWDDPKMVQYAGAWIGLFTGINYSKSGVDNGRFDFPCETLAGGAMLIKRRVAEKVGLYDEEYFIYYEDADYSMRIIKSGYKILYVPTSRIYHMAPLLDKNISTHRWLSGAFRTARNKIIFMRKYSPCFLMFILFYPIYIIFYAYTSIVYKRLDALINFYKGIISGFKWALFSYKS